MLFYHRPDSIQYYSPNLGLWFLCTVKGSREGWLVDVRHPMAGWSKKTGTGEILLNCMDKDEANSGYDLELTKLVKDAVTIPVIASSGADRVEHFSEVFEATDTDAALAPGIFHREELTIAAVKEHLRKQGTRGAMIIETT